MADLPPPLEDCSKQVQHIQRRLQPSIDYSQASHRVAPPSNTIPGPVLVKDDTSSLRKGFFSQPTEKTKKSTVINLIPSQSKMDSLRLPEVQKAMSSSMTSLLSTQSWMTPELMQSVISDPLLSKSMTDPKFQDALSLLQKDPKQAKVKYENDPEVTAMLNRFLGVFGNHFESLSKPNEDDALKNDPELAELVEYMRRGGRLDPRGLPPQLLAKVKLLIDKGLLRIQS